MQDLDTMRILEKIINMHNNISISINTLEKTIPISEKVCCDQDSENCAVCSYE
jgi:hypothetical protein